MSRVCSKLMGVVLVMVVFGLSLLISCGGGSDDPSPMAQPTNAPPETPILLGEDVVITIGNLSDLTGVSSNAQSTINTALGDLVKYYNDNDLIPGVELEVITYDGNFDPGRDIPGYLWLREKGADLLVTCVPPTVVSLKPTVDEDQFVMFCATGNLDELMPPGYAFSLSIIPEYCAFTLVKWISENHWDYEANGPAKIGGAAWTDTASIKFMDAVEEYAEAHPEQFEFEGAHLQNYSFVWGAEVEALKDCDYVFLPTPMHAFVRQFSEAGHETTFIGTDFQAAFMGMIDTGDLWADMDGALFVRSSKWWNEEGPIIDLIKEVLVENHASDAEEIMRQGTGYLTMGQWYQMLEIIKRTVEAVGPENFSTQTLYDTTISYSEELDGLELFSYGANKRVTPNYYRIQEARATERNLFTADPEWLPVLTGP